MRISARCDYTLGALLELAEHWPSREPLQVHNIARKQRIPLRYLVQILIRLKSLKLVESLRGKDGGYRLKKNPSTIYLGEVIREIEGPLLPVSDNESTLERRRLFGDLWKEVEAAIGGVIDRISFEDLSNKARRSSEVLTYNI